MRINGNIPVRIRKEKNLLVYEAYFKAFLMENFILINIKFNSIKFILRLGNQ